MVSSGTKERLIFGCITTVIAVLLILFSHTTWVNPVFFLAIFSLIWISLQEFAILSRLKGVELELQASLALSFLYLMLVALLPTSMLLPFGFLFTSLLVLFLLQFKRGSLPLFTIAVSLFSLFYLTLPLASLYQIAFLVPEYGPLWLLYLVVVVKLSDTAAYFIGSKWGRKKIAPYISPKKTVEGGIGGIAGSLFGSVAFYLFSDLPLGLWESMGLGLVLGVLAQIGDLSESLLKREVAIKDSGQVPGLGGILDMIDSLLFATPFLLIYLLL